MIIKDYTLNTDNFSRPKVIENQEAIYTLLVRLALLEKGQLPSHPDAGLGLAHYRFSSDLTELKTEFKKQIQTYLPQLYNVTVNARLEKHYLVLQVETNDEVSYPLYFNTNSKQIEDFIS